ncbi:hypothetical protein Q4561_05175 [Alteromonas sp. 1_MG-2023]|uniref:glycoside hydrolase family protein n=1 Tax=Alteromonas sp. 1_MG-2023 TaxID=3062669 RepID=UPI0026E1E075|nr:hypothetical protein [Alteromonas sp. 1_MG-2023]MDO6566440.1 hypothetical protein [Alteromonas sp. 1_MG-2023]
MHYTTSERLKRIQEHLGVSPDGVLGGETLSALEKRLLPIDQRLTKVTSLSSFSSRSDSSSSLTSANAISLTLSQKGIDLIVQHEISSKQYYEKCLTHPTWPKGESGITIGIGYDLGYASKTQFQSDWQSLLGSIDMMKLERLCGLKGKVAEIHVSSLRTVTIPFNAAKHVFVHSSLPKYAQKTQSTFPGVEYLNADAQAALVSLVYNRGGILNGDSRREMAAIKPLVTRKDYAGIALQITNMKRLWEGAGLDGLLHRRDDEANLVKHSNRQYEAKDLVRVA